MFVLINDILFWGTWLYQQYLTEIFFFNKNSCSCYIHSLFIIIHSLSIILFPNYPAKHTPLADYFP